jgi:hypothetical protein
VRSQALARQRERSKQLSERVEAARRELDTATSTVSSLKEDLSRVEEELERVGLSKECESSQSAAAFQATLALAALGVTNEAHILAKRLSETS